jgi:ubiquitin C-terminal hydrolase
MILNAQDVLQSPPLSDAPYHLCGVLVHLGTAMGGHYRAYVRSTVDGKSFISHKRRQTATRTLSNQISLF